MLGMRKCVVINFMWMFLSSRWVEEQHYWTWLASLIGIASVMVVMVRHAGGCEPFVKCLLVDLLGSCFTAVVRLRCILERVFIH